MDFPLYRLQIPPSPSLAQHTEKDDMIMSCLEAKETESYPRYSLVLMTWYDNNDWCMQLQMQMHSLAASFVVS